MLNLDTHILIKAFEGSLTRREQNVRLLPGPLTPSLIYSMIYIRWRKWHKSEKRESS
jgi:hypothetical protein